MTWVAVEIVLFPQPAMSKAPQSPINFKCFAIIRLDYLGVVAGLSLSATKALWTQAKFVWSCRNFVGYWHWQQNIHRETSTELKSVKIYLHHPPLMMYHHAACTRNIHPCIRAATWVSPAYSYTIKCFEWVCSIIEWIHGFAYQTRMLNWVLLLFNGCWVWKPQQAAP